MPAASSADPAILPDPASVPPVAAAPSLESLGGRTVALVGLMGSGKTSIGRRLAAVLGARFCDADEEIERAAGRTVAEIFAERGEAEFRAGERRVIRRLLGEPPHVLATGGGAFVQDETRALLNAHAVTVWLRADVDVLARRVARKATRPLLVGRDPAEVLAALAEEREGAYRQAHLSIDTGEAAKEATVHAIVAALVAHAAGVAPRASA